MSPRDFDAWLQDPDRRPLVMGVLNVTPDSFSDGGSFLDPAAAAARARAMAAEGADLIDVGGESTRPGATRVSPDDEVGRVVPVVRALRHEWPHVPICVDTVKLEVAHAALDAGAAVINDVSGLRLDGGLAREIAAADAGVVLMHSRGDVDGMASYELAEYGADPVADVFRELAASVGRARASGIGDEAIVIDPGLGFAKRTEHSLALLVQLERFAHLGFPILVGPSRKRFVGEAVAPALPVEQRLEGTIAACVIALLHGAILFRVHDVAPVRRALDFAHAVQRSGETH
jgi:dihydropteroate synthase